MDAAEWDKWGDDSAASTPQEAPRRQPVDNTPAHRSTVSVTAAFRSNAAENDALEASGTRGVLDWTWDLDAIDADLQTLAPADSWSIDGGADDRLLCRLATLAQPTRRQLQALRVSAKALKAQAHVTQWSLQQLTRSLQPEEEVSAEDEADAAIHEELQAVAGDWANDPSIDVDAESSQQIQEMSSLLACDAHDVAPFQLVLEQLFSSLPGHRLTIPTGVP